MLGIRLTAGVSDTNQIALVLNMGRDQGEMNPGTGNYIPGEGCPVLRGAWLTVSADGRSAVEGPSVEEARPLVI